MSKATTGTFVLFKAAKYVMDELHIQWNDTRVHIFVYFWAAVCFLLLNVGLTCKLQFNEDFSENALTHSEIMKSLKKLMTPVRLFVHNSEVR